MKMLAGLILALITVALAHGQSSPRFVGHFQWQPPHPPINGTIVYAAYGPDGHTHIYTVSGTSAPKQLTSGSGDDQTPEWSFDGTRITFFRLTPSGPEVFVMNADGGNLKSLSPQGGDMLPAFAAYDSMIYFMRPISLGTCANPVGTPATTQIMAMSATDGSARRVVVDGTSLPFCFNAEPQASADGRYIAWMCAPIGGGMQTCKINVDGSGFQQLTAGAGEVWGDPHWSPDSAHIVTSHLGTDGKVNLYTMDADGNNVVQLTNFSQPTSASDPGYSPDGRQIIFEEVVNFGPPNAPAHLSVINADGSGYHSLGIACAGGGCGPRFKPR